MAMGKRRERGLDVPSGSVLGPRHFTISRFLWVSWKKTEACHCCDSWQHEILNLEPLAWDQPHRMGFNKDKCYASLLVQKINFINTVGVVKLERSLREKELWFQLATNAVWGNRTDLGRPQSALAAWGPHAHATFLLSSVLVRTQDQMMWVPEAVSWGDQLKELGIKQDSGKTRPQEFWGLEDYL